MEALSLFGDSPFEQLVKRAGFKGRLSRQALCWIAVTWVPLLIFSFLGGSSQADVPFLRDFPIHFRLLMAATVLIVQQGFVEGRLNGVVQILWERGLANEKNAPALSGGLSWVHRLVRSARAEAILLLLAFVIAQSGALIDLPMQISTWKTGASEAARLDAFWYQWVSLTAYHFLLLRWIWKYVLWVLFLTMLSRAGLALQSHHPDRLGGLGFLVSRHVAFGTIAAATSIVLSTNIAGLVVHGGGNILDFKIPVFTYLAFMAIFYVLPLFTFTPALIAEKRRGLRSYGGFASRYVSDFEAKWSEVSMARGESPLGSPDIQSINDLEGSFGRLREMRLVLINQRYFQGLVLYVISPLLPLVLVRVPVYELIKSLFKLVL